MNRHDIATWSRSDGAVVLGATAVSGVAGYALTVVAHASLPSQAFVGFASFWAILFFAVATLAGVQQEIARGTRASGRQSPSGGAPVIRDVAVWCAVLVLVVLAVSSPWWAQRIWPEQTGWVAAALATGAACYVCVAAVSGVLYGVGAVRLVGVMIVVDGVARLILTWATLAYTESPAALAWALAAPFALVPLALAGAIRSRTSVGVAIDVGRRILSWNIARTTLAAAAIGVVVTALPFLIGVAGEAEGPELVASLQFIAQVTRAPLIVIVLSLQTLLVVRLRGAGQSSRPVLQLVTVTLVASMLLALLAAMLGPAVGRAFGVATELDAWVYGGVVLSGGLTASLVITGAALLARGRHAIYAGGWVVAALAQVALMATPGPLINRLMIALFVAPTIGILAHMVWGGLSRSADVAQQRT